VGFKTNRTTRLRNGNRGEEKAKGFGKETRLRKGQEKNRNAKGEGAAQRIKKKADLTDRRRLRSYRPKRRLGRGDSCGGSNKTVPGMLEKGKFRNARGKKV